MSEDRTRQRFYEALFSEAKPAIRIWQMRDGRWNYRSDMELPEAVAKEMVALISALNRHCM